MQALLEYAEEKPGGNTSLAEESLHLLGCVRTPEAACDLLVRAGALPLHSHSFRLAASAMPATFPATVADYSASLAANPPPDPDQSIRVDLTHLKVYTIDSYDTVEVDDGLSAETLPDGRIKVWIHVADPSRWMRLGDRLDTEARKRATSAYFATGVVPMIPFSLAAGPMSLSLPPAPPPPAADAAGADGAATGNSASAVVCAVTVVVTLNPDFSIDDVDIMNSFICPTYRLAYDQLPEMLAMAGEHEPELLLLSDVAAGRLRYRMQNGAANISIPESDIKVFSATSHCPEISVSTIDQSDPSRRLVSEAMVLCGEAVARFGAERDLPLPYRGQGPPDRMTDEDEEDMQALPEGPCRAVHLRSFMSRSEIKCSGPIPHAGLGLQGYVQFSSPIRRYSDLLAHYQVKALLRGEPPPLSVSDLDTIVSHCTARQREVRRAEGAVERYWLQEYLQRLPANTVLTAVMLKWLRADGSPLALMLVEEVGMETVMKMQRDVRVGDSVDVIIAEADPVRDKLRLVEAPPSYREAQMRGLADGGEEGELEDDGTDGGVGDGEGESNGEGLSSGEAWEDEADPARDQLGVVEAPPQMTSLAGSDNGVWRSRDNPVVTLFTAGATSSPPTSPSASLSAFLPGGRLPTASSAQATPLVKGKVFLRYVATLTPTRSNGKVVGDQGATGRVVIKGVKVNASDSYVVLNARVNNIKSGGAGPFAGVFSYCLASSFDEDFDGYKWKNITSTRGGQLKRYSFTASYVGGPVKQAEARMLIELYTIGPYSVVSHPKNDYALCGKMKKV
ncbi:unnamed protein product [Closterium sp. Yama58-4]|nr:unnamed protein product [Closterium sp. Yama58-4]